MTRSISLAAAIFLLATAAHATEPKNDRSARTKAAAAESQHTKLKKKKGAAGGTTAGSAGSGPDAQKAGNAAAALDPAAHAAVLRAKSVYMFSIESCENPDRCDAALRDGAEAQFMEACLACASQERCDAERAAIQGGSAHGQTDPCGK